MERLEAETQHVGARRKHSRSATYPELRARRGAAPPGQEAGARALTRRAAAQRFPTATAARQAQGRGALARVGQDRRHHHHESTRQAARLQAQRCTHLTACAPAARRAPRWRARTRLAGRRGRSAAHRTAPPSALARGG